VDDAEHENAVAYRRTADAFRSGDELLLASLIAPAVVWHVPGTHAMAGDIQGRDRLLEWLRQLRTKGFWLNEHDVLGNDDHVCALSIMGARRDGVDVQTRVVSVFHYRDGQQVEKMVLPRGPRRMEHDLRGLISGTSGNGMSPCYDRSTDSGRRLRRFEGRAGG
jgi:ketosteroid isomerase-like protein